jgi:hypothetical protein
MDDVITISVSSVGTDNQTPPQANPASRRNAKRDQNIMSVGLGEGGGRFELPAAPLLSIALG